MALREKLLEGDTDPSAFGKIILVRVLDEKPYVIPHYEFELGSRKKVVCIITNWSSEAPLQERLHDNEIRQQAFQRLRERSIILTRKWLGVRRFAALVPVLALGGCIAGGAIENAAGSSEDRPLVTGAVRVIENDRETKWSAGYLAGAHFWLLLLPKGAPRAVSYRLGAEPGFYWALAPGDYNILGFVKRTFNRETSGRLWAEFRVPASPGAVYIGDLTIRLTGTSVEAEVGDDLDTNFAALAKKYPGVGRPKVSLMKMVADQGSFSEIVDGCSGWGIDCDDTFNGVTPLQPVKGGVPDGDVASLQPTLEWKPSLEDGRIHYDVVVFEEIGFNYGLGAFSARLPGPAVAYVQNLWVAQFTLPRRLRHGASYNWSVRLRRGEVVTAWSRYLSSSFRLPGLSANPGSWFRFRVTGAD